MSSTAVLCGFLHTFDEKSTLKSLNQKKVSSLKNPTWIFTDFLNVFVLKSRLMKFYVRANFQI